MAADNPMPQAPAEFMRFNARDPAALMQSIVSMRAQLATAHRAGDPLATVDAAADLAGLLTTGRMEAEAVQVLEAHRALAQAHSSDEPAGWFWNAYATALQYCGQREQALAFFGQAALLAKAGGWRRLEALVLHHWGRCLAEQARFAEAEVRFSQALAIRIELGEAGQESSRRALVELSVLRNAQACK